MLFHLIKFITVLLLLNAPVAAETWVRGVLVVNEVNGAVVLSDLGERSVEMNASNVPHYRQALVECVAPHGASAFFSTSNFINILFEGEGSFAIERFEQQLPEAGLLRSDNLKSGQSRMILNFRAGQIAIDSRNLAGLSQFIVETPLGRITLPRALWQMRIEYDPRSRIYDFTITCSEGRVRFTDLQDQTYVLRAGQQLSGAGSRTSPSIEVGTRSEHFQERGLRFQNKIEAHSLSEADLEAFRMLFQEITQSSVTTAVNSIQQSPTSSRRPIVIEHAIDPPLVSPFRAEIDPPSDYQADLF
jgi:hypothetical protein